MSQYRLLQANLVVRKESRHQSEMINQLLYGERFEVLNSENGWLKIRSIHDHYEGWVEDKILLEPYVKIEISYLIAKSFAFVNFREEIYTLPFGSRCPVNMLKHNSNKNDFISRALTIDAAVHLMKSQFYNAPYLWGGRTAMGIDCSGFTQLYARCVGVELNRDAWQQASQGVEILNMQDCLTGDLIFFKNNSEKISHVGIYLGEGKIMHASGRVRIDLLNVEGIINGQSGKLTHQLVCYRRIHKE